MGAGQDQTPDHLAQQGPEQPLYVHRFGIQQTHTD